MPVQYPDLKHVKLLYPDLKHVKLKIVPRDSVNTQHKFTHLIYVSDYGLYQNIDDRKLLTFFPI
jgi:hypothetical protein